MGASKGVVAVVVEIVLDRSKSTREPKARVATKGRMVRRPVNRPDIEKSLTFMVLPVVVSQSSPIYDRRLIFLNDAETLSGC